MWLHVVLERCIMAAQCSPGINNINLRSTVFGFLLCSHQISLFSLRLQPIERKPLVYQPDSATSSHSKDLDNLPDEFFEVTVDDIRKRFAMLKSER